LVTGIEILDVAKTLARGNGARVEHGAPPYSPLTGGENAVLRGVTLRVPRGQCLGLRGATGAGKTTLLRLIAGLDRPERGEIRLNGNVVSSPRVHVPPAERRIGFAFQSLGLWPHLTVAGHLDYVLAAGNFAAPKRAQRQAELLEAFHLTGLAGRRPAALSGGEKHLLALARALAGDVATVLLDEPFAGLDWRLKERVIETLGQLLAARGLTTVLVSHEPGDLARLCRGVAHLSEGCVVEQD
jgi:iron(III) transport system ATP-binding protein